MPSLRRLFRATRRVARCRGALHPALAAAAVLASVPSSPARASIALDPAYITMRLDKGNVTEAITVRNIGDKPEKYRALAHHFVYSIDGVVRNVDPDEHSLAPWVKLNPREFTLGPHESRIVRIAVLPPPGLAPGEYWAALEFNPLEPAITQANDGKGHAVRIKVVSSIYVPIVGTAGEATLAWAVRGLTAYRNTRGIEVAGTVANSGTGRLRIRGNCQLLDNAGAVVAEREIGEVTVLPGSDRRFKRRFAATDLPRDAVRARIRYSSDAMSDSLVAEGLVEAAPLDAGSTPALPAPPPPGDRRGNAAPGGDRSGG